MQRKHRVCACGSPKNYYAISCRACRFARDKREQGDAMERLMRKVKVTQSGCWEFQGFRLPRGYGRIKGNGDCVVLAHRVSWEATNGPIPDGMMVCHRCDNPPCVNPEHLFLGTCGDNMRDMHAKGRWVGAKTRPNMRGDNHQNTRISDQQVKEIRERSSEPREALAAEFGTTRDYIGALIRRQKRKYSGEHGSPAREPKQQLVSR